MRYRIEAGGRAVGVDGDHLVPPAGDFELSFRVPETELHPGLINAHDHLHRNHYPRLGSPPYADAYQWGTDLHERWAAEIERAKALPRADALWFGALKNLLGGVTTVVHHDAWEVEFERDFPVRVPRLRCIHSPGLERVSLLEAARSRERTPLAIHLAEGVTRETAAEVWLLDSLGLLDENLLAVHAVGIDDDGIERLRRTHAALVWCPTSNLFLFGRTCPAELLQVVDVLLGTDSLLTGAGTMLAELRAAHATGWLSEARLAGAVGETAARRLGLEPPSLDAGARADIVLLRQPLWQARPADLALVVSGGRPRLGEPGFEPLFRASDVAIETLLVGGERRLVAAPLGTIAARVFREWPECARVLDE